MPTGMTSVVAMPREPREIDPTTRLMEGWKSSDLPIGPDGVAVGIPVTPESPLATINLCSLGPCVHYHELSSKLDAQEPQDGTVPEVFVNKTRTCYPAPGIEFDVGANPVHDCNLWEPRVDLIERLQRFRHTYLTSEQGSADYAEYQRSWPTKLQERDR